MAYENRKNWKLGDRNEHNHWNADRVIELLFALLLGAAIASAAIALAV